MGSCLATNFTQDEQTLNQGKQYHENSRYRWTG
jgi:hypothetical protein